MNTLLQRTLQLPKLTLVGYLTLIKLKNQKMKERNCFKNHIEF